MGKGVLTLEQQAAGKVVGKLGMPLKTQHSAAQGEGGIGAKVAAGQ